MNEYTYLIVGGGMAASAAETSIRAVDAHGSIGVISQESSLPYERPPLTKGLWQGKTKEQEIIREEPADTDLVLGRKVVQLLPDQRQVYDDGDTVYGYDKLLLATGGKPKRLPLDDDNQIHYCRTLNDYRRLRNLTETYSRFAVIGGGFIGSEIAAALKMQQCEVTMVFPDPGLCANIFPEDLATFLNHYYEDKGIRVLANEELVAMEGHVGNFRLQMQSGQDLNVDAMVAGIGIEVNTQLAEDAGMDVMDGVLVDRHLQTSDPHIYAAGDIVNFFDPILRERRRVEHEDNALTMGAVAGRNMAGDAQPYEHSPMFYSDLFDLGYEAVGKLDSSLTTVEDWQDKYQKGVVYYLKDDQVRGVLLWNVWDQVDTARDLIAKGDSIIPENLIGYIGDWGALDEALKETFPASDPIANW